MTRSSPVIRDSAVPVATTMLERTRLEALATGGSRSTTPSTLSMATSARQLLHGLVQALELEDEVVDVAGEGVGVLAAHADLGGAGAQLVEAGLVQPQLVGGRRRQDLEPV